MEKLILDRFNEKTIIYTGKQGDICREILLRAVKEGARIVMADNTITPDSELIIDIKKFSPRLEIFHEDLSNKENCIKIIGLAKRVFGSVDVLIDNTGDIFKNADLLEEVTKAIDPKCGGALIVISETASEEERICSLADQHAAEKITVNEVFVTAPAEQTADTVLYLASCEGRNISGKIIRADEVLGKV